MRGGEGMIVSDSARKLAYAKALKERGEALAEADALRAKYAAADVDFRAMAADYDAMRDTAAALRAQLDSDAADANALRARVTRLTEANLSLMAQLSAAERERDVAAEHLDPWMEDARREAQNAAFWRGKADGFEARLDRAREAWGITRPHVRLEYYGAECCRDRMDAALAAPAGSQPGECPQCGVPLTAVETVGGGPRYDCLNPACVQTPEAALPERDADIEFGQLAPVRTDLCRRCGKTVAPLDECTIGVARPYCRACFDKEMLAFHDPPERDAAPDLGARLVAAKVTALYGPDYTEARYGARGGLWSAVISHGIERPEDVGYGPTPEAAVSALEAALREADDANAG